MPSVFLSSDTVEYLKRNSNNQSMDSTVRRILNLDKNKGKLVKRQVGRTKLAPIEAYTWTIIYRLYMAEDGTLSRKALQGQVHDVLRAGGLFETYTDDDAPTKNGQPRWKQRYNSAIAHLRKNGCLVTESKAGPERYKGVNLRHTEDGLDAITDINLHLDGREGHVYLCRYSDPALDGIGTDTCPVPLNPTEIPYRLSGRFRGNKAPQEL